MKHTISIVLFFILSLGLNAQTVEGTVGSDGNLIPFNVSGGLDETAVDAKIETANALNISSLTSSRTLSKTDFGGIIKHTATGSKRISIPTQANEDFENDGVVSLLSFNDASKIIVEDLNNSGFDRLQLTGKGKMGTIARNGSDNWLYWGAFEEYVNETEELNTRVNSMSKLNNANALTGISQLNSLLTSEPNDSRYALNVESTLVDANTRAFITFGDILPNTDYDYEFKIRNVVGLAANKSFRVVFTGGAVVTQIWHEITSDNFVTIKGTLNSGDNTSLGFNAYLNRNFVTETTAGTVAGDIGDSLEVTDLSFKIAE